MNVDKNGGRFLKKVQQKNRVAFDPPHKQRTIVWGGSQNFNNDNKIQ